MKKTKTKKLEGEKIKERVRNHGLQTIGCFWALQAWIHKEGQSGQVRAINVASLGPKTRNRIVVQEF